MSGNRSEGEEQGGRLSASALPIPASFECPITQEVMLQPVITVDGQAYERAAIEQWFRRGHRTSPLTGATLPSLVLTPDLPLQRAIEEYMARRPEMERQVLSQLSLEEAARMLESELHEKALSHQSTIHHLEVAKRLVERLRDASSTFPEAALRTTVMEVASELESMYCTIPVPGASHGIMTVHAPRPEFPPRASSGCCTPPGRCLLDLAGHTGYVRCVTGLDADLVASGSLDSTAKVWSITRGSCVQTFEGHTDGVISITRLECSNGPYFATGSRDNTAKVWKLDTELQSGICLWTFEGHQQAVTTVAELNESTILSGSADHSVKVWSLATADCQATLLQDPACRTDTGRSVQSIATFGSNFVAVGSSSKRIHIWDVSTGQRLVSLKGHQASVLGVAAVSSGIVASCSSDRTVRLWDVGSGKSISILEGHQDDVNCITTLGSSYLVSGSSDETVKIWDIKSYSVLATLEGHSDSVFGVAAIGSDRALSASDDRLIKVWGP